MEELSFCRICLDTKVKLYHGADFNLQILYGQTFETKINYNFQNHFCYVCAAVLWKFNKFREKCERSQQIINDLIVRGLMTRDSILNINRQQSNLESSIGKLLPSHRVATYNFDEGYGEIFVDNIQIPIKEESDEEPYETLHHNFDDFDLKPAPFTESDDEPLSLDKPHREIKDCTLSISSPDSKKVKEVIKKSIAKKIKPEQKKREKRKANKRSVKKKRLKYTDEDVPTAKQKDRYATQKAAGYKFSDEKWKIVHLSEDEMLKEYRKRMDNPNYQNSVFRCDSCLKNFTCEDTLRRHMRVHDVEKGKHECFLCKRRFHREGKLRSHVKTHQIRYHCLRCPEICISSPSAIIHERTHEGHMYKCKYCEAKFVKITSFYTHVREKHRSSHVCATCGESFVSAAGLYQHSRFKHNEKITPEKSTAHADTDTQTGAHTHTYCALCDISFRSALAFEEHKNNSAMHADHNDTTETNSEEMPKLYKPGMCPKAGENNQFTCEKCNEVFSSYNALKMHSGRVHDSRRRHLQRYICEICGASLAPKSIMHHMSNHLNEKTFPCGTCGKVFKSAQNRSIHIRSHTGHKPYACSSCDKRFTQRHNAQVHLKSCLKRGKKTAANKNTVATT